MPMDAEKGISNAVARPSDGVQRFTPVSILILALLSLQSSLLILTMRFSRMQGDSYSASTAVFFSEALKILVCVLMGTLEDGFIRTLRLAWSPGSFKLAIPAALYVVQNNLQYFAASKLDAATLQLTYQLKILTTAVCFVWFMRRSLKIRQWLALFMLAAGVAVAQWSPSSNTTNEEQNLEVMDRVYGFSAALTVCVLSGIASVYFEKCVKQKEGRVSVWVRNLQLGLYSIIPVIAVAVLGNEFEQIKERGVLFGYTRTTYAVILLQAVGGILVANVMKYADSILKNFATSLSIVLSTVAGHVLWGVPITPFNVLGAGLVILSTYWFTKAT